MWQCAIENFILQGYWAPSKCPRILHWTSDLWICCHYTISKHVTMNTDWQSAISQKKRVLICRTVQSDCWKISS